MRGGRGVVADLVHNAAAAPAVTTASIALGFAFPLLVSAYAGARMRIQTRAQASLARFPDLKPDPVFRAEPDGTIVQAGALTRALFEQHGVARAQDVVGPQLWQRIATSIGRGAAPPGPEMAYFGPAKQWYIVRVSGAPDGINVYLTVVPPGALGVQPDASSTDAIQGTLHENLERLLLPRRHIGNGVVVDAVLPRGIDDRASGLEPHG